MEDTFFSVEDMKISYGTAFSVSNVTFSLQSGDILGLIGRSGSGKSTVIKSLVGIKSQDKGSILLKQGEKTIDLNDNLGYSPQHNALYPFLTIEENIMTFGNLYGMNNLSIEQAMVPLLKRLDLYEHRKKKIVDISGGMQKRADLATALIHTPKIIILDEPFTGLDISLQKFIWELLKELAEKGGIIIISSHILQDIKKNCNKYGLVEKGYYYNTHMIEDAMQKSKEDFESFLQKLFSSGGMR